MYGYTRLRGLRGPIVRIHPLTGEAIEPLGVVGNKVVWPMMGGAPDDDDDSDDDDDDDSDDADDSDDGDDDDTDKSKDKSEDDGDDEKVSKSEFDKIKERMRVADRRRTEAEKELQKIRDKDKPELEKVKGEHADLTKQVETLQRSLGSLRLENSFLKANKHSWHDAETALALAQAKGYLEDVVDEDGEVDRKALTKALDRLATEHKYLLADSDSKKDKTKDEDKQSESGRPAGGRKNNQKDKGARKQELRGRFSAIR